MTRPIRPVTLAEARRHDPHATIGDCYPAGPSGLDEAVWVVCSTPSPEAAEAHLHRPWDLEALARAAWGRA